MTRTAPLSPEQEFSHVHHHACGSDRAEHRPCRRRHPSSAARAISSERTAKSDASCRKERCSIVASDSVGSHRITTSKSTSRGLHPSGVMSSMTSIPICANRRDGQIGQSSRPSTSSSWMALIGVPSIPSGKRTVRMWLIVLSFTGSSVADCGGGDGGRQGVPCKAPCRNGSVFTSIRGFGPVPAARPIPFPFRRTAHGTSGRGAQVPPDRFQCAPRVYPPLSSSLAAGLPGEARAKTRGRDFRGAM